MTENGIWVIGIVSKSNPAWTDYAKRYAKNFADAVGQAQNLLIEWDEAFICCVERSPEFDGDFDEL